MKAVYVDTLYSLFLALLLCDEEETIFFLGNHIDINIVRKLKIKFYLNEWFDLKICNKLLNKIRILMILRAKKIDILYFQDHIIYSQLFMKYFKGRIYLLEDGIKNYKLETPSRSLTKYGKIKEKIKSIVYRLQKRQRIMGLSDRVEKIILTGLDKVPDIIKEKTSIVNIEKLWEELSEQRKERIKEIFNIDVEKFKIIEQEGKNIILFTQPLSEDGILDEHEKIEIYSKIIKNYDITKLVIKIHPREKTDYRKYFKDVVVMDEKIPMELLRIMGIEFKEYVTIFSTAALTSNKNIKINWYGTKIHPKLLKWFGDI